MQAYEQLQHRIHYNVLCYKSAIIAAAVGLGLVPVKGRRLGMTRRAHISVIRRGEREGEGDANREGHLGHFAWPDNSPLG